MKVYFSGAEHQKVFTAITNLKHKYVLMSYMYLKRKKISLQQFSEMSGYGLRFMIDSGAHTFHNKGVVGVLKERTPDAIRRYAYDYAEWLERNRNYIDVAVELDVHGSVWDKENEDVEVEYPIVQDLRQNLFRPLHNSGLNIIMVNHGEKFEECRKYTDFMGVSKNHTQIGSFGRVFTFARKSNTRIHGFAVTGVEIKRFHFDTVDSTTWLDGAKFGTTFYFTGSTLLCIGYQYKFRRKRFKKFCQVNGIDFEKFIADNTDEVNKFNLAQWKLYADYAENRWGGETDMARKKIVPKEEVEDESTDEGRRLPDGVATALGHALIDTLREQREEREAAATETPTEAPGLKAVEQDKSIVQYQDVDEMSLALNNSFLACNDCYLNARCPRMKTDGTCSYNLVRKVENSNDIRTLVQDIINIQYGRVIRGKLIEEADGGVPDKVLSNEMSALMDLLLKAKELGDTRESIEIKAKGGPGIIERIFGGAMKSANSASPAGDTVDATAETVQKEPSE